MLPEEDFMSTAALLANHVALSPEHTALYCLSMHSLPLQRNSSVIVLSIETKVITINAICSITLTGMTTSISVCDL